MAFYYNETPVPVDLDTQPETVHISQRPPVSIAAIALRPIVRVPATGTDADVRAALEWLARL